MARLVPDRTGRFRMRPHYAPEELDLECERLICDFLRERHGTVAFPVATDDLTVLLEREVEDLDQFADLPDGVEGVTEFSYDGKPTVRISRRLAAARYENRLRTTLAHEYGHVRFHACLWRAEPGQRRLPRSGLPGPPDCRRAGILGPAEVDWMEWQAGYVCGALLMPKTWLRGLARAMLERHGATGKAAADTAAGRRLIGAVQRAFQVSAEAARVRLLKLGLMKDRDDRGAELF